MRTFAGTMSGLLVALALAACNYGSGTGFIQLKAVPGSAVPGSAVAQPALYLDSEKLEPLTRGEAVLTRKAGSTKLQMESGGQFTLLCDILVRRNRITTVTLSVGERTPRCHCRTSADQGSRTPRTCIG